MIWCDHFLAAGRGNIDKVKAAFVVDFHSIDYDFALERGSQLAARDISTSYGNILSFFTVVINDDFIMIL